MRFLPLILAILALPVPPALAGPEVVATIAPVHSLVARVMAGAGAPHLLVPPAASPHHFALTPSDAAALERADLVVRLGPGIEPWLERPLAALAAEARVLRLDQVPGLTRLAPREGGAFEAHEHGEGAAHAGGEEIDPHLWLDPANARLWLGAIAETLAAADPERAGLYRANAAAAAAELAALEAGLAARLSTLRGRPFVVFHDGFRYFEHRFGVEAAGAVALSDARPPGPARIARVRALIRETGAACVFREPQFRAALVETVAEGTGARIGVLDPLGATLEPGPGLYPALLRGLADSLADCLG
jgi:zinc transport system substrate-binding protein